MRISPISAKQNTNAPVSIPQNNFMTVSKDMRLPSFSGNYSYFCQNGKKIGSNFIDTMNKDELYKVAKKLTFDVIDGKTSTRLKEACGYIEPKLFEKLFGDPVTPERIKALKRIDKIKKVIEKANKDLDKLVKERDALPKNSKAQMEKQEEINRFMGSQRRFEKKDDITIETPNNGGFNSFDFAG